MCESGALLTHVSSVTKEGIEENKLLLILDDTGLIVSSRSDALVLPDAVSYESCVGVEVDQVVEENKVLLDEGSVLLYNKLSKNSMHFSLETYGERADVSKLYI
ncbi:hypothetical protein DAPPUDRAFT_253946 [Daphnia pulex]|uniref:Uncharacterized protein n=1 Tax=Daphnia pulex TaxID=6669 RepID=E9H602_DAPPU|nr:hypothetical protein DAPPUDRAFT_253946 [Daphnia pulex]|eukprot:EFX72812.1 hypothetical protein DAPPUDRAFT_253946 [Daphnia pulex]